MSSAVFFDSEKYIHIFLFLLSNLAAASCCPTLTVSAPPSMCPHPQLQYVFSYHDGDVFGCVADIGWITGHSYIVYGPLANGGTSVLFESTPVYPDPGGGDIFD